MPRDEDRKKSEADMHEGSVPRSVYVSIGRVDSEGNRIETRSVRLTPDQAARLLRTANKEIPSAPKEVTSPQDVRLQNIWDKPGCELR